MAPRTPPLDEDHADNIRVAAQALQDAVREAARDGLEVRMEVAMAEGLRRNEDKITRYPVAVPKIWRPL